MFNVLAEINRFAVLVSTLVFALLGGPYFAVLVARPYRVALGIDDRKPPQLGPLFIVGPMACSLVVVTTCAVLLRALSVESFGDGVAFGLLVSIGLLVAQTMN